MIWPWRKQQRATTTPVTLNDPRLWEDLLGDVTSAAGIRVSAKQAMMVAAWWQGVSMISGDIGRMPIRLYRRTEELGQESRERLTESEDFRVRVVGLQPNEFFCASQFWSRVMVQLLVYGRAVVEVVRRMVDDTPARLVLLNHSTELAENANGELVWKETVKGFDRFIDARDALHLEWMGWGETDILCPYRQARNVLGLALAQERYASLFFRHGGRFGGVLELPLGTPKKNADKIAKGFEGFYSDEGAFKTVLLRDGVRFHASQADPESSQMVESSGESARQVSRILLIPPGKLGIEGSVTYKSKSEETQAYLDTALARWIYQIEQELNLKLLSPIEQEDLFFELDTSALTRLNPSDRAERNALLIQSKQKSPNEARIEENLPPYPGGERFENPHTSAPSGTNSADDDQEEPAEQPAG